MKCLLPLMGVSPTSGRAYLVAALGRGSWSDGVSPSSRRNTLRRCGAVAAPSGSHDVNNGTTALNLTSVTSNQHAAR
jgi:hypothetical protein